MTTDKKDSSELPIGIIIYTTVGALIIVAGVTAILRLSKIMIGDIKEMDL